MDKAQNNIVAESAEENSKNTWFGRLVFFAMIVIFPAFMIYLDSEGIDTAQGFSYITIGAIMLFIPAVILLVLIKVVRFVIGK